MTQQTYLLHFEGVSHADANLYASELREALLDASPEISVELKREDQHTQDFGSTLVLVLGTPTIVAAATAIGHWLVLRSKASLTIQTKGKKVIAKNISSKDAASLAEMWLKQQNQEESGQSTTKENN